MKPIYTLYHIAYAPKTYCHGSWDVTCTLTHSADDPPWILATSYYFNKANIDVPLPVQLRNTWHIGTTLVGTTILDTYTRHAGILLKKTYICVLCYFADTMR